MSPLLSNGDLETQPTCIVFLVVSILLHLLDTNLQKFDIKGWKYEAQRHSKRFNAESDADKYAKLYSYTEP